MFGAARKLGCGIAALVGLCLILAVIPPALRERPTGLQVKVAAKNREGECRPVVVRLLKDGSVSLNGQQLKHGELRPKLEELFRTRAYRVVFLAPHPDSPFQQVADVIDAAQSKADYVGLIAPSLERELRPGDCLGVPPSSRMVDFDARPPIELKKVPLWPW